MNVIFNKLLFFLNFLTIITIIYYLLHAMFVEATLMILLFFINFICAFLSNPVNVLENQAKKLGWVKKEIIVDNQFKDLILEFDGYLARVSFSIKKIVFSKNDKEIIGSSIETLMPLIQKNKIELFDSFYELTKSLTGLSVSSRVAVIDFFYKTLKVITCWSFIYGAVFFVIQPLIGRTIRIVGIDFFWITLVYLFACLFFLKIELNAVCLGRRFANSEIIRTIKSLGLSNRIKKNIQSTVTKNNRTERISQVHVFLDHELYPLESVCSQGCSTCCHQVVNVFEDEIRIIQEHVAIHFTPEEKKNTVEAAKKYIKKINSLFKENDLTTINFHLQAENFKGVKCPFLHNHLCSIYEVRPIECRAYLSIKDPKECQAKPGKSCNPNPNWTATKIRQETIEHCLKSIYKQDINKFKPLIFAIDKIFDINSLKHH